MEKCVREETAHLATLKSKQFTCRQLFKETADIETGMTMKSPALGPGKQTARTFVWFGEIERKLAKLLIPTFTYRSSSFILCS